MRQKKPTLFFSFSATEGAMAAESTCRKHGVPGRLVPVPREITAGCGLAWMSDPEQKDRILDFFRQQNLSWEGCHVLDFFR